MLSNPKEPSAGVKGYLKMSVSVLGQGEEAPPEDGEDTYQKDEDVEGNLLRPVGVESEPIDLLFKVRPCYPFSFFPVIVTQRDDLNRL